MRPAVSAEVRHNLEVLAARRRGHALRNLWRNRLMYLMLLPGLAVILIYRYVPMYGLTIAFKDFRVSRGILRSPWVGFENFEKFFGSPFFELIISNTIVISLLKLLFFRKSNMMVTSPLVLENRNAYIDYVVRPIIEQRVPAEGEFRAGLSGLEESRLLRMQIEPDIDLDAEWDAYVKEWHDSGGQQIIDEKTAVWKESM